MKWHRKRGSSAAAAAVAGRQMRSGDRPEAHGAVITANLSRKWLFQLDLGYRPSGNPPCQASASVWPESPLCPSLPSPARTLAVVCAYRMFMSH